MRYGSVSHPQLPYNDSRARGVLLLQSLDFLYRDLTKTNSTGMESSPPSLPPEILGTQTSTLQSISLSGHGSWLSEFIAQVTKIPGGTSLLAQGRVCRTPPPPLPLGVTTSLRYSFASSTAGLSGERSVRPDEHLGATTLPCLPRQRVRPGAIIFARLVFCNPEPYYLGAPLVRRRRDSTFSPQLFWGLQGHTFPSLP